jgi:hypothetical protein
MRVRVSATGLYTYREIVVVCGAPQFLDGRRDTLLNPTLIIEVLSPSTEAYDADASSSITNRSTLSNSISWRLQSAFTPICSLANPAASGS